MHSLSRSFSIVSNEKNSFYHNNQVCYRINWIQSIMSMKLLFETEKFAWIVELRIIRNIDKVTGRSDCNIIIINQTSNLTPLVFNCSFLFARSLALSLCVFVLCVCYSHIRNTSETEFLLEQTETTFWTLDSSWWRCLSGYQLHELLAYICTFCYWKTIQSKA